MTTPRKEDVIRKAKEIWFNDQWRDGIMNPNNPEISELKECGAWSQAVSELMRDSYRAEIENHDYPIPNEFHNGLLFDWQEAMQTGVITTGSSNSGKTYLNWHIAKRLMEQSVTVYVIDPSQKWNWMPKITIQEGMRVKFKDGISTVFDVSFLTYPQRIECANKTSKALLDARKRSQHDPPTFVIFEEGQLYVPEGSLRPSRKHNVCNDVIELITNGRNYNIRFGIITQFPSEVDKLLVKMCKQRYFGWSNEKNDIQYIQGIIGKEWTKELATLDVGEFVYSYPRRGYKATQKIKVPEFQMVMLVKP